MRVIVRLELIKQPSDFFQRQFGGGIRVSNKYTSTAAVECKPTALKEVPGHKGFEVQFGACDQQVIAGRDWPECHVLLLYQVAPKAYLFSRRHFSLSWDQQRGGVVASDFQSLNGTFVNRHAVKGGSTLLRHSGDTLDFGAGSGQTELEEQALRVSFSVQITVLQAPLPAPAIQQQLLPVAASSTAAPGDDEGRRKGPPPPPRMLKKDTTSSSTAVASSTHATGTSSSTAAGASSTASGLGGRGGGGGVTLPPPPPAVAATLVPPPPAPPGRGHMTNNSANQNQQRQSAGAEVQDSWLHPPPPPSHQQRGQGQQAPPPVPAVAAAAVESANVNSFLAAGDAMYVAPHPRGSGGGGLAADVPAAPSGGDAPSPSSFFASAPHDAAPRHSSSSSSSGGPPLLAASLQPTSSSPYYAMPPLPPVVGNAATSSSSSFTAAGAGGVVFVPPHPHSSPESFVPGTPPQPQPAAAAVPSTATGGGGGGSSDAMRHSHHHQQQYQHLSGAPVWSTIDSFVTHEGELLLLEAEQQQRMMTRDSTTTTNPSAGGGGGRYSTTGSTAASGRASGLLRHTAPSSMATHPKDLQHQPHHRGGGGEGGGDGSAPLIVSATLNIGTLNTAGASADDVGGGVLDGLQQRHQPLQSHAASAAAALLSSHQHPSFSSATVVPSSSAAAAKGDLQLPPLPLSSKKTPYLSPDDLVGLQSGDGGDGGGSQQQQQQLQPLSSHHDNNSIASSSGGVIFRYSTTKGGEEEEDEDRYVDPFMNSIDDDSIQVIEPKQHQKQQQMKKINATVANTSTPAGGAPRSAIPPTINVNTETGTNMVGSSAKDTSVAGVSSFLQAAPPAAAVGGSLSSASPARGFNLLRTEEEEEADEGSGSGGADRRRRAELMECSQQDDEGCGDAQEVIVCGSDPIAGLGGGGGGYLQPQAPSTPIEGLLPQKVAAVAAAAAGGAVLLKRKKRREETPLSQTPLPPPHIPSTDGARPAAAAAAVQGEEVAHQQHQQQKKKEKATTTTVLDEAQRAHVAQELADIKTMYNQPQHPLPTTTTADASAAGPNEAAPSPHPPTTSQAVTTTTTAVAGVSVSKKIAKQLKKEQQAEARRKAAVGDFLKGLNFTRPDSQKVPAPTAGNDGTQHQGGGGGKLYASSSSSSSYVLKGPPRVLRATTDSEVIEGLGVQQQQDDDVVVTAAGDGDHHAAAGGDENDQVEGSQQPQSAPSDSLQNTYQETPLLPDIIPPPLPPPPPPPLALDTKAAGGPLPQAEAEGEEEENDATIECTPILPSLLVSSSRKKKHRPPPTTTSRPPKEPSNHHRTFEVVDDVLDDGSAHSASVGEFLASQDCVVVVSSSAAAAASTSALHRRTSSGVTTTTAAPPQVSTTQKAKEGDDDDQQQQGLMVPQAPADQNDSQPLGSLHQSLLRCASDGGSGGHGAAMTLSQSSIESLVLVPSQMTLPPPRKRRGADPDASAAVVATTTTSPQGTVVPAEGEGGEDSWEPVTEADSSSSEDDDGAGVYDGGDWGGGADTAEVWVAESDGENLAARDGARSSNSSTSPSVLRQLLAGHGDDDDDITLADLLAKARGAKRKPVEEEEEGVFQSQFGLTTAQPTRPLVAGHTTSSSSAAAAVARLPNPPPPTKPAVRIRTDVRSSNVTAGTGRAESPAPGVPADGLTSTGRAITATTVTAGGGARKRDRMAMAIDAIELSENLSIGGNGGAQDERKVPQMPDYITAAPPDLLNAEGKEEDPFQKGRFGAVPPSHHLPNTIDALCQKHGDLLDCAVPAVGNWVGNRVISPPGHAPVVTIPDGCFTSLRSHQVKAVRFLWWHLVVTGISKLRLEETLQSKTETVKAKSSLAGAINKVAARPSSSASTTVACSDLVHQLAAKEGGEGTTASSMLPKQPIDDADAAIHANFCRGCVIAHTMGLGKSFTSIAFLFTYWKFIETYPAIASKLLGRDTPHIRDLVGKQQQQQQVPTAAPPLLLRTVVVVPKAVLFHWIKEVTSWAHRSNEDSVAIFVLSGDTKSDKVAIVEEWAATPRAVLLVSHQLLTKIIAPSPKELQRLVENDLGKKEKLVAKGDRTRKRGRQDEREEGLDDDDDEDDEDEVWASTAHDDHHRDDNGAVHAKGSRLANKANPPPPQKQQQQDGGGGVGFSTAVDATGDATATTSTVLKQYNRIRSIILEGTKLVVVDEAHKMASMGCRLSYALNHFGSEVMKIALTGTPIVRSSSFRPSASGATAAVTSPSSRTIGVTFPKPQKQSPQKQPTAVGSGGVASAAAAGSSCGQIVMTPQLRALLHFVQPQLWGRRTLHPSDMAEELGYVLQTCGLEALHEELPPIAEHTIVCNLTSAQQKLYDGLLKAMGDPSSKAASTVVGVSAATSAAVAAGGGGGMMSGRLALEVTTKSLMISNCIELVAQWRRSQFEFAEDAARWTRGGGGKKKGKKNQSPANQAALAWANPSLTVPSPFADPNDSLEHNSKLKVAVHLIHAGLCAGEKIVLFSNSRQMLDVISHLLLQFGLSASDDFAVLDGTVGARERDSVGTMFNDPTQQLRVLLLTYRSSGVGVSLNGASRVILFDVPWTAAEEAQAIFRVFRAGHDPAVPVHVVRLASNTQIETKLLRCGGYELVAAASGGGAVDPSLLCEMNNSSAVKSVFEKICRCVDREQEEEGDETPSSPSSTSSDDEDEQDIVMESVVASLRTVVAEVLRFDPYRARVQ